MSFLAKYRGVFFIPLFALFSQGCFLQHRDIVLVPPFEGAQKTVNDVSVRVRLLRDFECVSYFGKRLVSKGLQPIQLYIQNASNIEYTLNGEDIDLPLCGKRTVGRHLYNKIIGRSIAWAFGTLIIFWELFLPIWLIDSLYSINHNQKIYRNIEKICINPKEQVIIPPQSKVYRVLFVKAEKYNHRISMIIRDNEESKQLVFSF